MNHNAQQLVKITFKEEIAASVTHSQGTTVIRENKIAPLSKVGRFDKAIITTLARCRRRHSV